MAEGIEPRLWGRTILVFLLALLTGTGVASVYERSAVAQKHARAAALADEYCQLLHERLDAGLSATYALAALVRQADGRTDAFHPLARQMLQIYEGVSALQLAPGGVIRHIEPLAGNESALGHNLLSDPKRNREAFQAVETRRLTLAGPFPLLQGGEGVVGRMPIFLPDAQGTESFWGFSTALVRIPDLLRSVGLENLRLKGYRYRLWRVHPDSGQPHIFASSDSGILSEPVSDTIEVPNGRWQLSLEPAAGWFVWQEALDSAALVLLFALLVSGLARNLMLRPIFLEREVTHRTRELAQSNEALASEIAQRQRAQQALLHQQAHLEESVRTRTEELAALSAHLEQVREQEKVSIARELHDEFGGILTALKLSLARVADAPDAQRPETEAHLRDALTMVDESIGILRRMLDTLRPSVLDHLGIGAAIHWQAAEFSRRSGIPCEVVLFDDELVLDDALSITLFRILQEALTNVLRHAAAGKVTVSLHRDGNELTLEVHDDGIGLQSRTDAAPTHGLRGMHERVRQLGGQLVIGSQAQQGTALEVTLPLPG